MKWRATTGSKSLKTVSDGGYRSCFQVDPDAKKSRLTLGRPYTLVSRKGKEYQIEDFSIPNLVILFSY